MQAHSDFPGEGPVSRRILVAGLGDVLMSDAAVGPCCVAYLLANYQFPPEVKVVDLGTPGLDLMLHIAAADVVIAVDAIRNVAPGSLHVLDRASLCGAPRGPRLETHAPALDEAIAFVELLRGVPLDVTIVGVGGSRFEHGTALSNSVRDRVEPLAERVLAELAVRGAVCRRRRLDANVPWERLQSGDSLPTD
jgi:hydrogenase maturation protease